MHKLVLSVILAALPCLPPFQAAGSARAQAWPAKPVRIVVAFAPGTLVMPHYKAGKLKIIAQSTVARAPSLPEVPTYEESGLAGLVLDQWLGLFVAAGTPDEVVRRLNTAVAKILAEPALRERLAPQGLEAVGGSPEQFARLYREDYEKYGRPVKELDVKLD